MGNYTWWLMNSRSDFVYLTKNMHIPSSVASCKDGITASASATGTIPTLNNVRFERGADIRLAQKLLVFASLITLIQLHASQCC